MGRREEGRFKSVQRAGVSACQLKTIETFIDLHFEEKKTFGRSLEVFFFWLMCISAEGSSFVN